MKLKVVCDNKIFGEDVKLRTCWGFSCWIENGNNILFDTGEDGSILLHNMEKMVVPLKDLETVIISHEDYDHIGGLEALLGQKSTLKVCLLKDFSQVLKQKVKSYGANLVELGGFSEIAPNVYTTGNLGWGIPEQSLVLKTEKGLVIITGCAHLGIINVLRKVKKDLPDDILLVTGGFHLMGQSSSKTQAIISDFRKLGVRKVGPAHCTGPEAIKLFKEEYKDDFVEMGAGRMVEI